MTSNEQLPFPLWDEPNFGYFPLISSGFRNTGFELHTYKTDQLVWQDVNVGRSIWKEQQKLGEDVKFLIESSFENVKESIQDFLNEEKTSTPIVPKTPHVQRKTKSRRGIVKKRSSVGQTVRRSSRRLKQSLAVAGTINVDRLSIATEVGNVLQSITNSTPARGKRGRKKKQETTSEEEKSGPQKSISPQVQLTDCRAFMKPTPKTKAPATRKASIRGKRNVLLHEDGTFDVVPTLEHKKARKTTNNKSEVTPETSPKQTKQNTPEPKTADKEMTPVKEDNPVSPEQDTKAPEPNPEDIAMETADVVVVEAPAVEEVKDLVDLTTSVETDGDDVNTTSSSVCSSSAATVDLEERRLSNAMMNPTVELEQMEMDTSAIIFAVPDSDEEEMDPVMEIRVVEEKNQQNPRRSTRNSRRSSKILGGFAAKRRSTRQSLRNKTLLVAQTEEQIQPPPVEEEVDTETETVEESEGNQVEINSHEDQFDKENDEPPRSTTRPRPKIAKPIVRPKIKKHPPSARSSSMKRTHAKIGAAISASNNSLMKTPSPPKQKKTGYEWNTPGMTKSLRSKRAKTTYSTGKHNRSTEASRAKRTPVRASPANPRFGSALSHAQFSNINNTLKSFILRNTPEKVNKEAELEAKKKMLEEKTRKEEERQKQMEEQKQAKLLEQKRKREERAKRANQLREERERVEREKQDKIQDRWFQKIADADRCKNLRKVEEVAKMQSKMEKLAKAEARRKEEESEKLVRLKEQEEEREKRLKQHQKEKRLQEEQRLKEKNDKWQFMLTRRQEEKREEQRRLEEERIQQKLEEQKLAEEEEKLRRKREQEEQERARRKRELEAAMEVAAKKKKQEDMKKLAEQREEARKEREAARQRRMEEKRLAKEEEKRQKEEQKRIKEAEKRAREEEKRVREEKLMQQQEQERREEAQQIAQEKLEAEKEARRQAARQKKELLRQKIEAERRLREEEEKQKRIREEQERRRILQQEKAEMERKMKEAEKAKQQQLNSTYTAPAHSSVLEDSHNNYNMTPRGPGRPLLPSTNTDYIIADLKSDDSTDNEDEPKKPIPTWAKGSALNLALIQQHHYDLSSADNVFKGLLEPVSLSDLFPNKIKARYFKRTSSAHWTSPIRPPGYTSFTSQCKGF